jgi:hypothetical protein
MLTSTKTEREMMTGSIASTGSEKERWSVPEKIQLSIMPRLSFWWNLRISPRLGSPIEVIFRENVLAGHWTRRGGASGSMKSTFQGEELEFIGKIEGFSES